MAGHSARSPARAAERPFFGWVVVGGAFCVLAVAYGLQFSYGVFLPEIERELGWSRSDLSAAYAVFVFAYTALSYFSGRLTDRLGPQVVVVFGALGLGAGYALLSTIEQKWQLYLYFCGLAGIGASVAFVPCNTTVIRWFVRRRGLALGIASAGTSFASFAGPLIAAALVAAWGWRAALYLLGAGGALALVLASRALFRDPESRGLRPDGDPRDDRLGDGPQDRDEGWTLREAQRTSAFWLLFGALSLTWLVVFLPFVHLSAHALDLGYGRLEAAGLLSAIGLGGLAGRVITGGLTDRIGRIPGVVLALAAQTLAFFTLAVTDSLHGLYLIALGFGFSYSGISVLFPALLGDFFGRAHAGAIAGFMFAIGGAAAAVGPYFAGLVYDGLGSYDVAFVSGAVVNSLALLFIAFLRPPERTIELSYGRA